MQKLLVICWIFGASAIYKGKLQVFVEDRSEMTPKKSDKGRQVSKMPQEMLEEVGVWGWWSRQVSLASLPTKFG